jgi:hypothetical protein
MEQTMGMDLTHLPMFQHVRWEPDRGELRRFAIAMLVGFAVLGLLTAWRVGDFGTKTFVLWGLGIGLAVGALVPAVGRLVYLGIYLPTSVIGFVVSNIVLLLLFFFLFVPLGLILRLRGKDLLQLRRRQNGRNWRQHDEAKDAASYYRQF